MSTHEPFNNAAPLTFNESKKSRELFDRMATRIKQRAAENGRTMTDQEAIEATRNWIGFVELTADVAERRLRESKARERESSE